MTRRNAVPYPEQQPLLDFTHAADLLGIGRTSAYAMSRAGTFPVPIVRHGSRLKVRTVDLRRHLGLDLVAS